jgi:UDP-glucuronate 4-epimerase
MIKSTILVTGAAGFIGFHLTSKLLERGDDIIGIDNINDYYDIRLKLDRLKETGINEGCLAWHKPIKSEIHSNYTFIRMNLEDRDELFKVFKDNKIDKVCNLAAQAGVRYSLENPYAYINSNIVGFINILEACRYYKIKHLAYASSSSVYGNNTKMPLSTNDNVDHPISLYAATKKSNELMAHTYSHLYGIPTTGLRFFTVYGPWGRPDMALFLFTEAIKDNKPIKVFNNGNMVRDFTYVDDIVEGVIRVIDNPAKKADEENIEASRSNTAPYKVYNIGNSSPVQLMDYISAIEKNLGFEAKRDFFPLQPGDVPITNADVSDLVNDLDYKPNTKIENGVARFINWYKNYYK